MEAQVVVKHRLGLAVRLLNSITGGEIKERNIVFQLPEKIEKPISKGDGVYLFINIEPIDFELGVHVHGYEPAKVKIEFEKLQGNLPIQEITLIPEDTPSGGLYLSLQGKLKGIKAIEAVSLDENVCSLKNFESRKLLMTISNPHNVKLSHVYYGVLNSARTQFEKITVVEQISASQVKVANNLTCEWEWNNMIARIIAGQVDADGNYLLRVADAEKAMYLVHYVVGEKEFYQVVDFNNPEELAKGVKKNGGSSSKRS